MQYLALIYSTPEPTPDFGTPEFETMMKEWRDVTQRYQDDGVMLAGEALQPVETATSLRLRDGKLETMDGPFAETKEQLGGYYLLECKDLDEAIKYASMIPTARTGTVEVRPIMDVGS
jgi:hypothetical protein